MLGPVAAAAIVCCCLRSSLQVEKNKERLKLEQGDDKVKDGQIARLIDMERVVSFGFVCACSGASWFSFFLGACLSAQHAGILLDARIAPDSYVAGRYSGTVACCVVSVRVVFGVFGERRKKTRIL